MRVIVFICCFFLTIQLVFSQSAVLPYVGIAFTNLEGQNVENTPQELVINSGSENSKGFVIGLRYIRPVSDERSSLGLIAQSNLFKTDAYVTRVSNSPIGIKFREIAVIPFYEYQIFSDRLHLHIGPRLAMLTGHREIFTDINGNESVLRIKGRDNFSFGLQFGLRFSYRAGWIGANVSLPLSFQDKDRYRKYLKKYTTLSISGGYRFQFK